jgi:hypothetical protein
LRKCWRNIFGEVGAQGVPLFGVLAFGLIGDPSIEFSEKFAGMKKLAGPGDRVGSGHDFSFIPLAGFWILSRYRDTPPAGRAKDLALLNPAGMQQFQRIARRSTG